MKRSEVRSFRPKKSEAFALCEAVYGRHCGCSVRQYPCFSWRSILLDCAIWGFKDARAAELHRISVNRKTGSNHMFPSNAGYRE